MAARKLFPESVIPLPDSGITPQGMVHNAEAAQLEEPMDLTFSFQLPDEVRTRLEEKVAKGEVVPAGELDRAYSAKPADVAKLVSWLKAQGYEISGESADSVYARATPSQIGASLQVNMVRVTKDGLSFTAAKDVPSLPEDVGSGVRHIIGLQPFRRLHKHIR